MQFREKTLPGTHTFCIMHEVANQISDTATNIAIQLNALVIVF